MTRFLFNFIIGVSLIVLSIDGGWFAQTGLSAALLVLLAGGTLIFAVGVRDLLRDLWRLHTGSHKSQWR
jgi:hypothetical protein